MITLGNELVLQLSIGPHTDFIDMEDFKGFRIALNAGGIRPIIDLTFQVNDLDVIPYLNTGNIISLMHGIKEPTSDVMQFEIFGDNKTKDYRAGATINLSGGMYNRGFTSKIKSRTYKCKSFQALQSIANQNGLKFNTNVTRTNDNQSWYQSGMTDWEMVGYIATRAYKDASTFFAYGFDNNNLYFYDVKELMKQGPKWFLSVTNTGNKENSKVVNIGSYQTDDSHAGINAELAGKNVTNVGYNLDTGEISSPTYSLKSFSTLYTNNINVNSTGCQNYNYMITTGDEHAFCMQAINQNKRNNILFSSYTCYVPIPHEYRDFKLFDCVQLIPNETDAEAEGLYIITGIAKEFKDNMYWTVLTLNRESGNGIKGNLEMRG